MSNDERPEIEDPPILGSWRNVYTFVLLFLVVEIVLFYLFSLHFA